jgi:hypothetical protein
MKGKAKELFEKWYNENYEFVEIPSIDDSFCIDTFYDLPASMQWGVYQDFADSMGHEICVEWYKANKWWAFVGYTDVYSPTIGEYKTRQEARNAAIEKLNELIN